MKRIDAGTFGRATSLPPEQIGDARFEITRDYYVCAAGDGL